MSKLFNIDLKDVLNGFFSAFSGAVLYSVYTILVNYKNGVQFGPEEIKAALVGGAIAGVGYLIKRYFSNETGTLFSK